MMRLPFLLPKDHPIVQRELNAWRRYAGVFRGLYILAALVAIGILYSANREYSQYSGSIDRMTHLFSGMFVAVASLMVVWFVKGLNLIPRLMAATTIAREHEMGTWEALKLTALSAPEILKGKLSAVFYQTWPLQVLVIMAGTGIGVLNYIAGQEVNAAQVQPVIALQVFVIAAVGQTLRAAAAIAYDLTLGMLISTGPKRRAQAIGLAVGWFVAEMVLTVGGFMSGALWSYMDLFEMRPFPPPPLSAGRFLGTFFEYLFGHMFTISLALPLPIILTVLFYGAAKSRMNRALSLSAE